MDEHDNLRYRLSDKDILKNLDDRLFEHQILGASRAGRCHTCEASVDMLLNWPRFERGPDSGFSVCHACAMILNDLVRRN